MQDLFYIIMDDEFGNYNKKSISVQIKVKTNNFKIFHSEYNHFIDDANKKIRIYEDKLKETSKAIEKKVITPSLKKEIANIKILLEDLKNGFRKNCFDLYNEFNEFYLDLDDEFNNILSGEMENEQFVALNLNFLEWYSEKTRRKLEVCERLKTLENSYLKALVIFDKNNYETHFTKYHLNLESYSDILHGLLKIELEEKFIKKYRKIEAEHFRIEELIDVDDIPLRDFLKLSSEMMNNYEKMFQFPQKFLKVQHFFNKIETKINEVVNEHSKITKKLKAIIDRLRGKSKSKKIILKSMSLFYEFPLVRFEAFHPDEVLKDKIIHFIENKKIALDDEVLLPILETIEPNLVNSIKKRILKVLKNNSNYEIINKNSHYMMKKNKNSIFENRQYYSHEMMTYQFLPESHEEVKSKNSYLSTAGYEKIYREKKLVRIRSEVYSKTYEKRITYTVFMELHYYMINPHISQRYA